MFSLLGKCYILQIIYQITLNKYKKDKSWLINYLWFFDNLETFCYSIVSFSLC